MNELAAYAAGRGRVPMSWSTYDSLEYDDALRGAEYMDGELLLAPGLPDWGHQMAIDYLREQIRPTLAAGEHTVSGFGWKPPGQEAEFGPDVMVIPTPRDRRRFTGVPLLVVEVTSSNRLSDTVVKRAKYAEAGLEDYWIVDREDRVLRINQLDDGVLREVMTIEASRHKSIAVSYTSTIDYRDLSRTVELDLARLFPKL